MPNDHDTIGETTPQTTLVPNEAGPDDAPEPDAAAPDGVPDAGKLSEAEADPATATVAAAADATLAEAVSGGLTWIPYALYLGGWIALAGVSAYLLGSASADQPALWMPEYPALVFSGIVLAALGPVLSLAVWIIARSRRPAEGRRGLLASALTRGALVAFFGAMIWIVSLYLLEVFSGGVSWR